VEVKKPFWLPYPRATEILAAMDELINWPKRSRMPNLLIVGPTNNGKTTIIEEFMRRHPVNSCPTEDSEHVPVIFIHTPPVPDEKAFYNEILMNFATPILPSTHARDKRRQVISLLTATRVRMLIIDDIQDVMAGDLRRHRSMLVVIKYLSNKLQIPIVAAGIESAQNAIQAEPQLSNRFQITALPRWTNETSFSQLLANFEAVLPLRERSSLHAPEIATLIHQMTEGVLGEISMLLSKAAAGALRDNEEKITSKRLKALEWAPPSARRKAP
jgi:DNA polymerase III delta prime subunit